MSNNLWFMGTGKFAALCLEHFTRNHITFKRIITGLPTRSGRNNKDNPSQVEQTAQSLGLSVERTGKLSENASLVNALTDDNPAVIFVIDFGQIIREPFLSRMCLNIHPSLLPEYRGAAPIQRALLDGKAQTGVTVFRLVKEMDAGPILAQSSTDIFPTDNASDLYARLSQIGCELAAEVLRDTECQSVRIQDHARATFAPKLDKTDFALSFNMSAQTFVNHVRALDMSGGAYALVRNKRVKIWRAKLRSDLTAQTPGQVLECTDNPVISCADYAVELLEVQSEGKARVRASDWLRGLRLQIGDTV